MNGRRPYVRSMRGWWRRDRFFVRYMVREVTALFVAAYAFVLLIGMVRLSQGEAAYNAWLDALRTPWSIAGHVVLLIALGYHTWSWFAIMPKTMPMVFVGGKRVGPETITRTGMAVAGLTAIVFLLLLGRLAA